MARRLHAPDSLRVLTLGLLTFACGNADSTPTPAPSNVTASGGAASPGLGAGANTGGGIGGSAAVNIGGSGVAGGTESGCPAGQTMCSGACADLSSDSGNCGQCGALCGAGQGCIGGTCTCIGGATYCGGGCTDTALDVANCGGCGVACFPGESCTAGSCTCQQGLTDCAGTCTNLLSDGNNCGSCGTVCSGQVCSVGVCTSTCTQAGQVACGSSCVDLASDPLNCGACATACPAGQGCQNGVCSCPDGQQFCSGQCVDVGSSAQHCGGCGVACTGGQLCTGGACVCPGAGQLCSGSCTDTQSNASNCGGCGVVCASGQSCTAGSCVGGSGGELNTGGGSNTGGAEMGGGNTGGASTGGLATGGAATGGGSNTGGAATGGVSTGGASTGGSATGGESTGGGSTGGTGTGGDATGGTSTGGTSSGFDPRDPPYILGADVSFVQEQEDQGRSFRDNGTQKDLLAILKDHGFNYIRLRLFHTPGNPLGYQHEFVERAEPYCDTSHTIEMAQRVKAAGMGFSLDFHYSDTWADPDDQNKPLAWEGLSLSQLVTELHDYTLETLQTFQASGVLPDMVQIGNEITPGMLLPEGSSSNFANLAQLLKAGLQAVNEVDSGILKVMHIEGPHLPDTISWWANAAVQNGVEFDILGVSCYSAWHGQPPTWQSTFERVASEQPNLRFMIAEYADNYRAANDIMHDLPQGLGTLMWEPTADGEWGRGLFESNGNSRAELSLYDQMAIDYGLR